MRWGVSGEVRQRERRERILRRLQAQCRAEGRLHLTALRS